MYRDPRTDALARMDAARSERARTWAEVRSMLDAIDVLREQLATKGIEAARTPSIEPPAEEPSASDGLTLADALRTADAIERDCSRLRTSLQDLTTLATVLGDRVMGRRTELPLGAPPRAVPFVYLVAEALPAWLIFVLPAAGVIGALFGAAERGNLAGALLPFAPIVLTIAYTTSRALGRVRFLARCRVAGSVTLEREDTTMTKNTNVPMRVARGWKVSRESYTGHTVKSHLRWMGDEGSEGTLVLRGTPYEDGVVLHEGPVATCVVELACAPRPDHRGQWEAKLAPWVWVRVVVVSGLFVALTFGLFQAVTG